MDYLKDIPSVSNFTNNIKLLLEDHFYDVVVHGEISRPKVSSNGHIYFTLKDAHAQLPCVMWKSSAQRQNDFPEHGRHVIAAGEVQVYPPHGKYQLIVTTIREAGTGVLQEAFEKLKKKLQNEGLFDPAHKKPLPVFPRSIGLVTSSGGAAFQDIIATLKKRFPLVKLYLCHAAVQGLDAAGEIARGIRYFSESDLADVLIVGRGGGSLEDLWAFNEEIVARAIYQSRVPVISAVGHETDFSISDFVADHRAATPTQAAAMAVPDINELRFRVDDLDKCLREAIVNQLRSRREKVDYYLNNHALNRIKEKVSTLSGQLESLVHRMRSCLEMKYYRNFERCKELTNRLQPGVRMKLMQNGEHFINLNSRLKNGIRLRYMKSCEQFRILDHRLCRMDPMEALGKGFAKVIQNGEWIRTAKRFESGHDFKIQWSDGIREVKTQANPENKNRKENKL